MIDIRDEKKKVLVVEDDASIADLLAAIIEAEGYVTLPAFDGEAAVQIAQEEKPDLITLDLALPKKNGHDVLHDLVGDESTRGIPVIVVSAYTNRLGTEDRRHVAFVVSKPFDIDDLADKVRYLLDSRAGSRASLKDNR